MEVISACAHGNVAGLNPGKVTAEVTVADDEAVVELSTLEEVTAPDEVIASEVAEMQ